MEANVQRTWKPIVAGTLNIITGALSAGSAIGIIIAILVIDNINIMQYLPIAEAPFITPIIVPILIVFLVISIIIALFSIFGGVFALKRRKWGWALAGSIIAILSMFTWGFTALLGMASTIFVAIAKEEFE